MTCTGCYGDDDCCTINSQCGEDEGDCDDDADCKPGLKCGIDNCSNKNGYQWDEYDDCCYTPGRNMLIF